MKVLIGARSYPTPISPMCGIFEFDQAKAIAAYGNEVAIAAIDLRSVRHRRRWGIARHIYKNIKIYWISVPIGAMPVELLDFVGRIAFEYVCNVIEREWGPPDVVHTHFSSISGYAVNYCRKKDWPFVVTEHEETLLNSQLTVTAVMRYKKIYSAADRLITVSSTLRKAIEIKTGCSSIVIPNVIDMSSFHPDLTKSNVHGSCCFISVGNLCRGKGFDLLIEAFCELTAVYPECTLEIYGDGPEKRQLLEMISNNNMSNHIRLMGLSSREVIALAMRRSDVFVLASRRETFGLVYAEAMASGLPVIATKCGGPEDFVVPETGILIPVNESESLRKAMEEMVTNRESYDSQYISQYSQELFSANMVGKKIIEVYRQVIDERNNTNRGEEGCRNE